jgi:hypothetical protein
VASGFGWTITTPVCLASALDLLDHLRPEPMPRGRFARQVQVVARAGELGDLPRKVAALATQVLKEQTFPPLIAAYPWFRDHLVWPADANADG